MSLKKEEIIKIIAKETGLSNESIAKEIEDTVTMMENMVNEEGAAYVVANNHGVVINQDQTTEALKLNQLIAGQTNITVMGKIQRIYNIREFTRKKDNSQGRVRNLEIVDASGEARVALWDNKVDVVENKQLSVGSIIRISGASTKIGFNEKIELSLGAHGVIDTDIKNVDQSEFPETKIAPFKNIGELSEGMAELSIRGKIVDKQNIHEFERNGRAGKVTSITLLDEKGRIRITFWNENCSKISKFDLNAVVELTSVRLGKNKNDVLELTFNDYSTIRNISDDKLETLEDSSQTAISLLSDITESHQNVTATGKVIDIGPINNFTSKDGSPGQVQNITFHDKSQSMRVVFWGEQVDQIKSLSAGDFLKVVNVRPSRSDFSGEIELSVGNRSEFQINPDDITDDGSDETSFLTFEDINAPINGVSFKLRVLQKFEEREITRKDGSTSKVLNFSVADENDVRGKIAAWDGNIEKISNFEENEGMQLQYAKAKPDSNYGPEITITNSTIVEKIDIDDFNPLIQSADKLVNAKYYQKTNLDTINEGSLVRVQGTIVKAFKPSFYDSCTKCSRKVAITDPESYVGTCETHGEVDAEPKMILNLVLDDTFATITITFFNREAELLLSRSALEAKDEIERLNDQDAPITKSKILMKEIWIEGKVDLNKNNSELRLNCNTFGFVDITNQTDEILDRFEQIE